MLVNTLTIKYLGEKTS